MREDPSAKLLLKDVVIKQARVEHQQTDIARARQREIQRQAWVNRQRTCSRGRGKRESQQAGYSPDERQTVSEMARQRDNPRQANMMFSMIFWTISTCVILLSPLL